jgi:hypothetical protein
MKTFTSQIESHTQIRHSFCSRMLMTTAFALVFVMTGLPQAASAVTSITACPYIISSPGQYRLDVDCSVAPGGAISASNVHLNLHGDTISGPGCSVVPGTVGIIVGASDVHINNGTAKALSIGIQVTGNPGVPVEHNHLNNLKLRES